MVYLPVRGSAHGPSARFQSGRSGLLVEPLISVVHVATWPPGAHHSEPIALLVALAPLLTKQTRSSPQLKAGKHGGVTGHVPAIRSRTPN